jgi:hypothetical protein
MKTWYDIKQAALEKLFLTIEEAEDQGYLSKFPYLANECLTVIANGVKPNIKSFRFEIIPADRPQEESQYYVGEIIKMPEDFLSFADRIILHNNNPYDDIVYLSDNEIVMGELGNYVVYYNATWDHIVDDDNTKLTIPISILNCLPTYIASQCLSQDDVQRSAILKNEFELMLSRLDTDVMYQNNHFRSSGGWY